MRLTLLKLSNNSIHIGSEFGQVVLVFVMKWNLPMGAQIGFTGTDLRRSISGTDTARPRDLGVNMDNLKAALVMAQLGDGTWEIYARLYPMISDLEGFIEVTALKRNSSGINEKSGTYDHYPAFLKVMLSLTELAAKEVV